LTHLALKLYLGKLVVKAISDWSYRACPSDID
jgi:hypothetical protein